jgi:hypothetical protein
MIVGWKKEEQTPRGPRVSLIVNTVKVGQITQYWANCFRFVYLITTETGSSPTFEKAQEDLLGIVCKYHNVDPKSVRVAD